jgi:hypothetical protein
METAEKLELHYYFDNTSHSMDAFLRNKCEAEVLAVFQEIADTLGIQIVVESVAYREGGLKEIWQFLGKNKDQLTLLIAIIVLILSRFPPSNSEQDKLTKEVTRLTIEEKMLNIEKLKRELHSGSLQSNAVESASSAIDGSLKVATRKSNFYKNLIGYKRVTGIGLTPLTKDSMPTEIEKFIDRSDFNKFILLTDKLPVLVVEDATIEIVAPVLKEGNYHWRGIYEGTPIGFSMIDEEFKNSVLREEVSFQHGSIIECVLNIHRKIDEIGDIVVTGYSVVTVIKKSDGAMSFETIQGKRHLARRKDAEDQIDLF